MYPSPIEMEGVFLPFHPFFGRLYDRLENSAIILFQDNARAKRSCKVLRYYYFEVRHDQIRHSRIYFQVNYLHYTHNIDLDKHR